MRVAFGCDLWSQNSHDVVDHGAAPDDQIEALIEDLSDGLIH